MSAKTTRKRPGGITKGAATTAIPAAPQWVAAVLMAATSWVGWASRAIEPAPLAPFLALRPPTPGGGGQIRDTIMGYHTASSWSK